MHRPRSVRDAEIAGKRVLVRVDFNVPLENGRVADDTRIRAAMPTIDFLLEKGAGRLILLSHLGRPKRHDPAFSLRPVAQRLAELLERDVAFDDPETPLTVLENTRFQPGETKNEAGYAAELAHLADVYVNDAFGSAHRSHGSTEGIAHRLPAYAGLLLEAELRELSRLLIDPARPFVMIAGGAKVADKIGALSNLARRADTLLVGGKMAEELRSDHTARERLRECELRLPSDVVAAAKFEPNVETRVVPWSQLPDGWLGLDVGPETCREFAAEIEPARTVFWNGPMGVCEWPRFMAGTKAVAEAVAAAKAHTVVGGGDSIRALDELGLTDEIDWVSTGGGASLELLEGKDLPGVVAIPEDD